MTNEQEKFEEHTGINLKDYIKICKSNYIYMKVSTESYQGIEVKKIELEYENELTFDYLSREFVLRPDYKEEHQLAIKDYGKTWWTENNFPYNEKEVCVCY